MPHVNADKSFETELALTTSKRYCNVLFWNIHGQKVKTLGDKFSDTEFLNICTGFDILGICELHTNDKPSINGFKLIKHKIRKKLHKGPKLSGGVAVFAKKGIAHMVNYVNNNNEDSIWVKLCKEDTGEPNDIYLGTCYVSPSNKLKNQNLGIGKGVAFGEVNPKHRVLELFFEEANYFKTQGEVIIQGDVNARTGCHPDFIASDKFDNVFGIENQDDNPIRNSEDKITCERGAVLLDLCKSLDFRIANGRKAGDIFGKYTSIQWNGSSVVDYVMTSLTSFYKITDFKVGKFYPWFSDHCPLLYTISLTQGMKPKPDEDITLTNLQPRCRWTAQAKCIC